MLSHIHTLIFDIEYLAEIIAVGSFEKISKKAQCGSGLCVYLMWQGEREETQHT